MACFDSLRCKDSLSSIQDRTSRAPEKSQPTDGDNDPGRDQNEGDGNPAQKGESRKTDKPKGTGRRAPAERRVYVSNIPYEFKWQDLKDLFQKEVGEVAFVEMFNDENNRPRGCAIIEFDSTDMVKKAIDTMHRHELKGRKLVVKEDFDTERDKYGRIVKKSDLRNVGQGGELANLFGLSPQFLESLGISGPVIERVFVANLDYKIGERTLRDLFGVAGKVVNVQLIKGQDGKSRGFGKVTFTHPVEAVQAISMLNNQMYHGRALIVRMDRMTDQRESTSSLPRGLRGLGMGLGANGAPILGAGGLLDSSNLGSRPNMGGIGNLALNNAGVGMGQMGGRLGGLAGMGNMGKSGTVGSGLGMNNNRSTGMVGGLAGMAPNTGNMGTGMGMGNNALGSGKGSLLGVGGVPGSGGMAGRGGLAGAGGLLGRGSLLGKGSLLGRGGLLGSGGLVGSGSMGGSGSIGSTGNMGGTGGMSGSGGVGGLAGLAGLIGLVGSRGLAGAAPSVGRGNSLMQGPPNNMGSNLGTSGSRFGGYGGSNRSSNFNRR